jgi:hypothetical protein
MKQKCEICGFEGSVDKGTIVQIKSGVIEVNYCVKHWDHYYKPAIAIVTELLEENQALRKGQN